MTSPALPTRALGFMDSDVAWGHVYGDFLETVPDLMWPASTWAYAQLRRDPQLTAVLAAYMLPIRRATWALDPAGCRPEVAQLVADDLGLPILGADKPGAARVRGVSWRQHLRAALLCLVYGHMPFEMLAEIRDGKARLVELSERMPHTIGQIHVDKVGNFAGITQTGLVSHFGVPEIGADRLVWYAHDREGASWQGTSLLRPAYAPWLLKREMQRVLATSNRRFGMGVPTVEWANGTNPTPGQIAQGQQAASAARVGDQAGLALPPGAHLVLTGLSGSVPDTLGFMKWLDVQMSRMALAGFIDLGETTHGSRALGQTFIDLLIMSLQSVADDLADTVTRQAAARIVEWNWGTGEPVPRVAVADIGSRREVTAEALQLLLSSGALSPDPALEAFIRSEYRLPQRSIPWVEPKPPSSSKPSNSPLAAKRAATGQLELPIEAAGPQWDLSPDEVASGADFAQMQQDQQAAEAKVHDRWPDLAAPIIAALVAAAGAAVATGTLADLGALAVPPSAVAAVTAALADAMTVLAKTAAKRVVAEAATQGVTLAAGDPDETVLAGHAAAVANVLASGYANGAARTALLNAGPASTAADVELAVRANLEDLAKADSGFVNTAVGSAMATAAHTGRVATLENAPAGSTVYVATEVLDKAGCGPCAEISGTRFATLAEATAAYPAGHYVACAGRERCRGAVLAIFNS